MFTRRQLIFSFDGRVISFERSLRVHSKIDTVRLYHDLQLNSGTLFLSYIFDIIHQWICLNELYKLRESFFFLILNELFSKNRKILKLIVNIDQSAICYIAINGFVSTRSTN